MVGGPVFGPQPRLKQAAFILTPIAAVAMLVYLLSGCAHEVVRYAPIPAGLIPHKPVYESVKSDELSCLSDSAYERLVRRFRSCEEYAAELRVLLGE